MNNIAQKLINSPPRWDLCLVISVFLGGCTVGADYQKPDINLPQTWHSNPKEQAELAIQQRWWQNFNDPVMDGLISQVVANNLDFKLAQNRLAEARATRNTASAVLLPAGDMMASANRQGNQLGFPGGNQNGLADMVKQPFNMFKSGFDASWELDIFGGHKRDVESAQAEVEAAEISRQDILISTLAEVARTYVEIRQYQAQLQLAGQTIDIDKQNVAIATERVKHGDISGNAIPQAEARQQQDEAQIAYYTNLQMQAEYSLDVLMGATPGTVHDQVKFQAPLPVANQSVIINAPAHIIAQRPDVRHAERKLASATAQQGVALAKFFPDISLSGFVGLFNTNASNFLSISSKSFGMGASVLWPILSYGTLSANMDAADARQQQALTQYQKSILTALADVERTYTAWNEQEKYTQSINQQTQANQRIYQIALERHQQGLTSSLEALEAERGLLASQNQLTQAKAQNAQNLIAVYKSLGGGWQVDEVGK